MNVITRGNPETYKSACIKSQNTVGLVIDQKIENGNTLFFVEWSSREDDTMRNLWFSAEQLKFLD